MKSTTKYISAAFAMILGAGCSFFGSQSANYCDDAAFNNCMNLVDAPIDGPSTGCVADPGKCTGATLVCEPGADVCVECTTANAAACVGMEPVCGMDNSCRGCTEHSECASAVCLPDGSCAAESDVAYVDGGVGAGTTCTKAAPCKTVTAAVAPSVGKAIVKVTGTVVETSRIVIGSPTVKTVIGAPGAKISGSTTMVILEARGGANVIVADLEIGSTQGFEASACVLLPPGETVTVRLLRSTVRKCTVGVNVLSGTAIVDRSTITLNGAGIQQSSGGTVTVTGATVTANDRGGVSIANSTFKLVNNFIASNGNSDNVTGSSFGGVSLDSASATNQFDQNTVVYNHQKSIAVGAAGVTCLVTNFAAARNIISSNNAGLTFGPQTAGGCTFPNSYVMSDGEANTLGFVNINTLNFHLTAASPATVRDVAGLTTCPGNDIDGEARPFNALCDLGADEYKP